jgi:ABC-type phosphate transport system ATPase subunit
MGSKNNVDGVSISEIEDLIHNFLIIMLEHSMRQKDGWRVSASDNFIHKPFCFRVAQPSF